MSTREIAFNIFNHLTEEQLQGFIQLFSGLYSDTGTDSDRKMAAFEELEKLRTPMQVDEEAELDAWRKERFG